MEINTLVAFGGGGGMHAVALATELGCRKVIVPRGAAVFSALGMMMSDLRRDAFVTRLIFESDAMPAHLEALLRETVESVRARFRDEGVPDGQLTLAAFAKCRYRNQEHAVEVPVGLDPLDARAAAELYARFHAVYEREYGYRLQAPVEVVGVHLIATASVGKLELTPLPATGAAVTEARKGRRLVDYAEAGRHEADIYDAGRLEPGMRFAGPAVVEDPGTTVVVHPGNQVRVDPYGNLHITLA